MRKEEIKLLSQPYNKSKDEIDRRLNSAIGADVPSAAKLAKDIFDDLDINSFGISWWSNLPNKERILISDYLYQCVYAIEVNLVEARIHYLEFLGAREKINERMANCVSFDSFGNGNFKIPPAETALDDLPNRLESMHICGFFRAIGSTLDCLGSTICGVLALKTNLRKADIGTAGRVLSGIKKSGLSNLQTEFFDFYESVKTTCGETDWLEWTDQYRNMYVHRGRRTTFNSIKSREIKLFDAAGQLIPRAYSNSHLAKYPDRTDVEEFINTKNISLSEDAEVTLKGIFVSSREFVETISEKLLAIWKQRREDPTLLCQPQTQWDGKFKNSNFAGYNPAATPLNADTVAGNPKLIRRMQSASALDHQCDFWTLNNQSITELATKTSVCDAEKSS